MATRGTERCESMMIVDLQDARTSVVAQLNVSGPDPFSGYRVGTFVISSMPLISVFAGAKCVLQLDDVGASSASVAELGSSSN